MELRHLRYFEAVAEEGSFTRAAARLCMAQPPLSRQIKDLEEELGTELFDRTGHRVKLTESGQLFRPYARQVLELVEKSAEDIREMNRGLQGTLYLASVEGHAPRLLAQWIAAFHEKYPAVQYDLWNGSSDDVIARADKGLCDAGVIVNPYNPEGLSGLHVYAEPWIAILPKHHPLAEQTRDTVTPAQLAPYELLIPSRQSRQAEIESWFRETGHKPIVRCRLSNLLNAYELVERGCGIAIYPASSGMFGADRGICTRVLTEPSVIASYELVWSKARPQSRLGELFCAFVAEQMAAQQNSPAESENKSAAGN